MMKRDLITEMPPFVAFIDGAAEGWEARVRQCLEDGQNFFVLLAPGREGTLAEIVEFDGTPLPAPESKAALLSTARFMDQMEFRLPNQLPDQREHVYHVEQLVLPRTRPPLVKTYLLYCYVRGIISQHDLPSDARVACDAYNDDRFTRRQFPEAAIYRWEQDEWRRTRLC
jgi:hypothetical protein